MRVLVALCVALFGFASAGEVPATVPTPLRVEGLVSAVVTPLTPDGLALNLSVVPAQAEYLAATGVSAVFVGGTTGESLSLTVSERKALVEAWARIPDMQLIVHVGAESVLDAVELARHAADNGAVAVGFMPSTFFKPATVQALGATLETVAAAVPSIPTYYYHIPSMTGVEFAMLDLLDEMETRAVPNFAGVKYTGLYETRAFPDFMRCAAAYKGKYEILCGREEMMVEALAVGATGFIGSQFNFAGDIYTAIMTEQDPTSRNKLQLAAIELLYQGVINGVPTGTDGNKAMCRVAGVPVGPPRLPSLPISDADLEALRTIVKSWCEADDMGGLFSPMPLLCKNA